MSGYEYRYSQLQRDREIEREAEHRRRRAIATSKEEKRAAREAKDAPSGLLARWRAAR